MLEPKWSCVNKIPTLACRGKWFYSILNFMKNTQDIISIIYSVQNLGESPIAGEKTVTLVPVCLGTCWGLGPPPCLEGVGTQLAAWGVTGGRPWQPSGLCLRRA